MSREAEKGDQPGQKLSSIKKFFQARAKGTSSTMRYNPFKLFTSKVTALMDGETGSGEVYKEEEYNMVSRPELKLRLRRRCENNTTAIDVRKAKEERIDNTGNFHWPAEEILAHVLSGYLVKESQLSSESPQSFTVEIGAGFGLAGFFLAKLLSQRQLGSSDLMITDGNSGVVATAVQNVALLRDQGGVGTGEREREVHLSAALLRWDDPTTFNHLLGKTRRIIGADVLFFEDFHDALVAMILSFIQHSDANTMSESEERSSVMLEEVLIVAPSRGKSLQRWAEKMTAALEQSLPWYVTVLEDFDSVITAVHDVEQGKSERDSDHPYNVDRHRALLVKVHRRK